MSESDVTRFTPGPWEAKGVWLFSEEGTFIAHLSYGGVDEPGIYAARANARRIVQCVNSHDELVEALRNLVVMLPSDCPERDGSERIPAGFIFIRWQDLREARSALSKAQGESGE
jgi:hypothetical protein